MSEFDVFISYNREDLAVARLYAEAFASEGLDVWWDQTLRSGDTYDEITEAALRRAKAVVVLWSPRSVASRWVRAEATIADRCKTLAPVTIEPCERPVMFELTQTLDLSHWRGDRADPQWRTFLVDVNRRVGRSETGLSAPVPPPATPAAGNVLDFIPAIGVLPISTRLGDEDDDAGFAADLTDELLAALSRYSIFRILPGSMSASWRPNLADLRPVARELGALYLFHGALRRFGEGFRVTVKLVEGDSGKILWSQKFARPLAELDALPDALAQAIAAQADDRASWLQIEQTRAKTRGLTAWDHVFRAIYGQIDTSTARLRMAVEENRLAVTLQPQWSLAHATMAFSLAIRRLHLGDLDGSLAEEANRHVNTAVYLDKTTPVVLMYAGAASSLLGNPAVGMRMVQRAQGLHPGLSSIHFHLQVANLLLGQLAESVQEGDLHISTSASEQLHRWVCMYLSAAHYLAGDNVAAVAATERGQFYSPGGDFSLIWRIALLEMLGDGNRAREEMAKLHDVEPELVLDACKGTLSWTLMADAAKAEAAVAAFTQVWTDVIGLS